MRSAAPPAAAVAVLPVQQLLLLLPLNTMRVVVAFGHQAPGVIVTAPPRDAVLFLNVTGPPNASELLPHTCTAPPEPSCAVAELLMN